MHQLAAGKGCAAGSNQHRIQYDRNLRVLGQNPGDCQRKGGRAQHADLDCSNREIRKHGLDLREHDGLGHHLDCANTPGILGRYRRQGGDCVDSEGGKAVQVCLDTGTTAGIGTGDAQHDRWRRGQVG